LDKEVLKFLKKQSFGLPTTREEVLKLAKKEVATAKEIQELTKKCDDYKQLAKKLLKELKQRKIEISDIDMSQIDETEETNEE
jgi:ribosomal protein L18E